MAVAGVVMDRPQRWDEPFADERLSKGEIEQILAVPPFSEIDEGAFPASTPLRDILENDTRLVDFRDGDIVCRQGDYGTSAFYVISGKVRVVLKGLSQRNFDDEIQGTISFERRGFFSALKQLWSNSHVPEARDYKHSANDRVLEGGLFIQDVPAVLDEFGTALLEAGSLFGELSALGRTPRTTSIFAEGEAVLLEIRWQGLRDISSRAPKLREQIERSYRENALAAFLRSNAVFAHLNDEQRREVEAATSFASHGNRDWVDKKRHARDDEEDAAAILRAEPVIEEEGNYPNGLLLIRSGFARVSQKFGNGHRTLRYLSAGQHFGLEEIVANWRNPEQPTPYRMSLRAVGYVDALLVPTRTMEEIVLPTLPDDELPTLPAQESQRDADEFGDDIRTEYLEELVDARVINGTQTMMIDLERCTRCDDCVRACAATHGGNPRFVRHGSRIGRFMIANACMHCQDPVCMLGCPTGAIQRWALEGQVVINDKTCIGCSACANNCPYDNIRMVGVRDKEGAPLLDSEGTPIIKATKCDLCIDQNASVGPACQNACPHDALKRVDMRERNVLMELLER